MNYDTKDEGIYRCAGCCTPLFSSETKYESGSGFPSYYAPISDGHVATEERRSHGVHRIQVLCAMCDAHLGHVFPDDSQPTGKRYCINSAALVFDLDAASE